MNTESLFSIKCSSDSKSWSTWCGKTPAFRNYLQCCMCMINIRVLKKNLVTWRHCCRQTSGSSYSHQPEKSLQENLNATPELPSNNLMALKNWPNKSLGKTISHIHPQEPVWFQWDNTLNSFSGCTLSSSLYSHCITLLCTVECLLESCSAGQERNHHSQIWITFHKHTTWHGLCGLNIYSGNLCNISGCELAKLHLYHWEMT